MSVVDVSLLLKERALESTAEGVVIVDAIEPGMPIIYVNHAFTAMTGYTSDEVVGQNCRFLQGPKTAPATRGRVRHSVSQQQPCTVEILNYRKDGSTFWNRLSITPVRDETGQVTHYIGIQSDVTRRREAEDGLRAANKEQKHDLQAAAAFQRAQLPQNLPEVKGFRFGWRFHPCQELAGDGLNILQVDEEHVATYVLDVSGHGVRAALQSFSLAQDLRPRESGPNFYSPEEVLSRLNTKYPLDTHTGMFFTILYGVVNIPSRTFTFASAGHPGPVLARSGQAPKILETSAYLIGVSSDPGYQSQELHLQSGDKLLLFTDGVVEALSARNVVFGEDRLLKVIERNQDKTIDEILDAVMQAMKNWACHINLRDDLALVGIEAV